MQFLKPTVWKISFMLVAAVLLILGYYLFLFSPWFMDLCYPIHAMIVLPPGVDDGSKPCNPSIYFLLDLKKQPAILFGLDLAISYILSCTLFFFATKQKKKPHKKP